MTESVIDRSPLFELRADVIVEAPPAAVYAVVSDLRRSGEWSPECQGGEWVIGEPSTVGAVFRGENLRSPDVVGWAPLVRGTWYTDAEVTAAEPGRTFQWVMRTHAGANQDSVWGFDMEPADGGCRLTHHFRMGHATEGIYHIVEDMDEAAKQQFVDDWSAKLADDLDATLARIKAIVEREQTASPDERSGGSAGRSAA